MKACFEISILGFDKSKTDALMHFLGINRQLISANDELLVKKNIPFLKGKGLTFIIFDHELLVSLREPIESYIFKRENLKEQLSELEKFFGQMADIVNPKYILASFEFNGTFLMKVKDLNNLDDNILNKFPFVYKRNGAGCEFIYNEKAQDIF